jgi:hypothetical protein
MVVQPFPTVWRLARSGLPDLRARMCGDLAPDRAPIVEAERAL